MILKKKEETLYEKEHELIETQIKKDHARKNFRAGIAEATQKYNTEKDKIDEYVSSFGKVYGRRPMKDEIENYMTTSFYAQLTLIELYITNITFLLKPSNSKLLKYNNNIEKTDHDLNILKQLNSLFRNGVLNDSAGKSFKKFKKTFDA